MKENISAQRIESFLNEDSISSFNSSRKTLDVHRLNQKIIPKDAHVKYNSSLRKGRHPRSFKPVTEIWNYVNIAERRRQQVASGERLWNVIETDRYYSTLEPNSREHPMVPETNNDEVSQKHSRHDTDKGDDSNSRISSNVSRDGSNPVAGAYYKKKEVHWVKRVNRLPNLESLLDAKISKRDFQGNSKTKEQGKKKGKVLTKSLTSSQDIDSMRETLKTPTEVVFNKKREAPVYFGMKAGLESSLRNSFLTINYTDGSVVLDDIKTTNKKNFLVFTFVDLFRPDSFRPLRYGDHVWLKICSGNGDADWQNGSVLGSRIDQAKVIGTVPLDPSVDNNDDGETLENEQVGIPLPILATLPTSKDEKIDEKQARDNNHRARILGGWIIRCAKKDLEKERGKDGIVYNLDEVYLEQDFSYISEAPQSIVNQSSTSSEDLNSTSEKSLTTPVETGTDPKYTNNNIETSYNQSSNTQQAPVVLRQLPGPRSQNEILQKYGLFIDRHAVFRIRIADVDDEIESMTGGEKKNEIRMRKAKLNLRKSTSNRNGKRIYHKHKSSTGDFEPIKGGENFPQEIRACMTDIAFFAHTDKGFIEQVEKESKLHDYYRHAMKTRGDPLDLAVRYSEHFANDANKTVNYGPCEPLSRSMFSETSSYSSPFNFVKEVRFKPSSEIPLNGIQLRNVALHSRVSAFRPGNRKTLNSVHKSQNNLYNPNDSLSISSTLATDSLICPEDDEGSLTNESIVPPPGRKSSEISFDSTESCLLCHSADAFDICEMNQLVKKDIRKWRQLKEGQNSLGYKITSLSPSTTPRPSSSHSTDQSKRSSLFSNMVGNNEGGGQDNNSETNGNTTSAVICDNNTPLFKVRETFMGIELKTKEELEKQMKQVDNKLLKHIIQEEKRNRLEEFQNLCKKMIVSIQNNNGGITHIQSFDDDATHPIERDDLEISSQQMNAITVDENDKQEDDLDIYTNLNNEEGGEEKEEVDLADDAKYLRQGIDISLVVDEKAIFDAEVTLEKYFASNSAMMKEMCISLERLLATRVCPVIQQVLKGTKDNKKSALLHELAFLNQVMENIEAPIPHEFINKLYHYTVEGFRLSTISFRDITEPIRNLIKILDRFVESLAHYCYGGHKN